jgi:Mg2+ and Co2+ transporter CorA
MSPYEDSQEADVQNQFSERYRHRLFYFSENFVPIVASIATMFIAVGLGFFFTRTVFDAKHSDTEGKAAFERILANERQKMTQERDDARQRLAALERTNADLADQLKTLKAGKPSNYGELSPADKEQINRIRGDEEQLQSRLGKLEEALETSPEKALSTVMIKQRLDALQDRTHGDIDSIHGEIGRLFTLTQWFIGLIFTIALGLLGLALANLRRPKA